jgi:hypothetical protein
VLNILQEMCFYLKGLDVEMLKTKTKILQVLAEPSGYTGETQLRVPSGPLGEFWVTQKLHWRNPILGTA